LATQEERRTATRTAIINAAQKLFGAPGFDETKIDDIAAKAGVAKGAIYHHFKNKNEIFEAVFEQVSAEIVENMIRDVEPGGDTLETLMHSMKRFFDLCTPAQVSRILLLDGPVVLGHADWQRLDARHFGGLVTLALKEAMDAGAIRHQPLEPLSRVLLGGIQAAAIDCAAQKDFEEAAKSYLNVFKGILHALR